MEVRDNQHIAPKASFYWKSDRKIERECCSVTHCSSGARFKWARCLSFDCSRVREFQVGTGHVSVCSGLSVKTDVG